MSRSSILELKTPSPERIVEVSPEEGFAVRGLSPLDVYGVWRKQVDKIAFLIDDAFQGAQADKPLNEAELQPVILALLADAPAIAIDLIVLASGGSLERAGEFDQAVAVARTLPIGVQADALQKIADLTFTTEMPLSMFTAMVVSLNGTVR